MTTVRKDPLASLTATPLATPQSQPIPGREADMIRNDAGGYAFRKDLWNKLEDFVVLGTTGGTYYADEKKHTVRNFDVVLEAVQADSSRAVMLAADLWNGTPPRAPRPHGAMFVLAAVMALGDEQGKQAARILGYKMGRTTDHRVMFWGYYKQLAGKRKASPSHTVRKLIRDWYTVPDADRVAFTALKGKSRTSPQGEQVSVADMLQVAHPKPRTPEHAALFEYLVYGRDEAAMAIPSYAKYKAMQDLAPDGVKVTKALERKAAAMVRELGVPWEFVPSALRTAEVWAELAGTTGLTAVLRNLGLMARLGALEPLSTTALTVVRRLTDPEEVRKARIHPVDVWLASKVYGGGVVVRKNGDRETWTPVSQVLSALDKTFELSFGNVNPTRKRLLIAVDCSGSMGGHMYLPSGTDLGRSYDVAGMMAAILARIEPNIQIIEVDTQVHASTITAGSTLAELLRRNPPGGATDMAKPLEWALDRKLAVDGFVILTDNETWAGSYRHPSQALKAYRDAVNKDARMIVVSMYASGYSIGDPKDDGVLQISGLDASLPQLVAGFIR